MHSNFHVPSFIINLNVFSVFLYCFIVTVVLRDGRDFSTICVMRNGEALQGVVQNTCLSFFSGTLTWSPTGKCCYLFTSCLSGQEQTTVCVLGGGGEVKGVVNGAASDDLLNFLFN